MLDVIVTISIYLTLILGVGVLIIACYYVWDYAVKLILTFFKLHGLFIRFMYEYYNEKHRRPSDLVRPEISDKEAE
ncbi:hypothetical protein [Bacillus sp. 03113]|uniref:hypothetical protein n=1 Tax=Bacillus sp. 03113 TaxID=2578211 RepID=UPI0015E8D272|nr:hypothetical protein [Bacillus sp. 03113]